MQTPVIEKFAQYQASLAFSRISTGGEHELASSGMATESTGTTSVAEKNWPISYLLFFGANKVTVSDVAHILGSPDKQSEASDTSIVLVPEVPRGAVIGIDELQEVVDRARSEGLREIADRLVELAQQHYEEDELPLQTRSVTHFLEYFLFGRHKTRPLMTVTPEGELDATWEGPDRQSQVMRFFPDGSVWVAYKLSRGRGSFESTTTDFLDPEFHYKVPEWA